MKVNYTVTTSSEFQNVELDVWEAQLFLLLLGETSEYDRLSALEGKRHSPMNKRLNTLTAENAGLGASQLYTQLTRYFDDAV